MSYLDSQDEKIKEYYKILEPDFPEWLDEYINTPELLKQQYDLDWRSFKINDVNNHKIRKVRSSDIKGDFNLLGVFAIVYENNVEKIIHLQVADILFVVSTEENPHQEKTKEWQELLASKENAQTI